MCKLQCVAGCRDTAVVRHWMPRMEPRGLRWQRLRPLWPDADDTPHSDRRAAYELRQHRPGRLADGDEVGRRRARQRVRDIRFAKRGPDEHPRIGRANGCTQDLLEVASKIVKGTNQ